MNTYSVAFPLRTITLQLHDKTQTAIEAEALVLYGELHNELWTLRAHWQQCLQGLQEHRACLQNCMDAYDAMEAEAKKYGTLGGYDQEYLLLNEGEEHTLRLGDLQRLVERLSSYVDEYNDSNEFLQKMFEDGMQLEDRFSESFSHFNKEYFSPIIQDYNTVQVDTPSLDADLDDFRGCCEEASDLFEQFQEEWEAVVPLANGLSEKVKATDRHLKIIGQGFELANPFNADPTKAALN